MIRHLIDRLWAWATHRRDAMVTTALAQPAPPPAADPLAPLDTHLMATIRELID